MSKPKSELVYFDYSRLDRRIVEAGLTREQFAKLLGKFDRKSIGHLIENKWNPWASEFLQMNKVLKCSMRDMVELKGVEYRELPETLDFSGSKLSFKPLRDFLDIFGISPYEVFSDTFNKVTVNKLSMDRDVNMKTIASVCKKLRIPPDHVMKLV